MSDVETDRMRLTREALEDIDAGLHIPHAKVEAWVEQLRQSHKDELAFGDKKLTSKECLSKGASFPKL
ncbi:MAG: hypothetical protein VW440_07295 [Bordetella sp.]|jgi:hypothetical protein